MSWRNRQLDLRCLDDVGVLDLVWLLSEEMTSCNFMRQCSKSQLWAEPEDEDVTVLTLEQEPERRPELDTTGSLHRNRGSSADSTACRSPFTHTVRTNSGLCEDCQRAGCLPPHTADIPHLFAGHDFRKSPVFLSIPSSRLTSVLIYAYLVHSITATLKYSMPLHATENHIN